MVVWRYRWQDDWLRGAENTHQTHSTMCKAWFCEGSGWNTMFLGSPHPDDLCILISSALLRGFSVITTCAESLPAPLTWIEPLPSVIWPWDRIYRLYTHLGERSHKKILKKLSTGCLNLKLKWEILCVNHHRFSLGWWHLLFISSFPVCELIMSEM